jgi:hypothetical protein
MLPPNIEGYSAATNVPRPVLEGMFAGDVEVLGVT